MNAFNLTLTACLFGCACWTEAQIPVIVSDSGVQTGLIRPGAPAHTVGLERHTQTITLDTGVKQYGLRYIVAKDPKDPRAAIPGEGYIGMPDPANCNWYTSGFFDLQIDKKSVGTTMIHSLTGRGSKERGTADFVFDTPQSVVRIRFVARPGEDCLFAQALLEPKTAIKTLRLALRCYPSAFVSDADRHVLTPSRDLKQGERVPLDLAHEWWTLYHDRLYDAGYAGPTHSGAGPCAALWIPTQNQQATISVGNYAVETSFDLNPGLRDFRFIFFDWAGTKNEAAKTDIQKRAPDLLRQLATFPFTDPAVAQWPLDREKSEIERTFASVPGNEETAAKYDKWAAELAEQLKRLQPVGQGAIMAEAAAAKTIAAWEAGLSELKLKALLNEI